MMLLRTLVLERNGQDAPVNGALLCGFAVGQMASNFLVYSLDEEVEPGSSRVYIAALRMKMDRYFLGGVESQEGLQVALNVFKQILTLAASGSKAGAMTETQVPFHFIDLKGCKLPPARPEDHHSVIIKKALVMKVITLGMTAPTLPAIESTAVIVPSIRFSSQMTSAPRLESTSPAPHVPVREQPVEDVRPTPVETTVQSKLLPTSGDDSTLFEVDSTLTNLARVAQELTQQKLAAVERENALEQWQLRLQLEQSQLDERVRELEQRTTQLHDQSLSVSQRSEALKVTISKVSALRQNLRGMLLELDQTLDS
ncbi:hypothetical protein LVW35_08210 [Pseudomonas sp. HN11]|uniref:hypothetical protein n=1 Tax=Pseudomonas sp. HN11 TaxID=1344094 RepID=UPI001F36E3EE|nr:hypothetical protein [Pseudomonas sp. HN11]UII73144.1 hypothetical protein LVW35_08210 [Pseudomonas sp. HN11]